MKRKLNLLPSINNGCKESTLKKYKCITKLDNNQNIIDYIYNTIEEHLINELLDDRIDIISIYYETYNPKVSFCWFKLLNDYDDETCLDNFKDIDIMF